MNRGLPAGTRFRRRSAPLVLCYHAVSEEWEHPLSVAPRRLARQLWVLLRWYRPLSADAVLRGDRGFHITFDDAFRSVTEALPMLSRLGAPATVFACSDYGAGGMPLAVPELAAEAAARPAELATMTWEELRELRGAGLEIGSHTKSHPHLPRLDDAELDRELTESRERIEDELHARCRFLAYPFGDHDERVREAARRAGYSAAFALPGDVRDTDPFAIPRLGLWRHDGVLRTAAKIGFAQGEERVRAPV